VAERGSGTLEPGQVRAMFDRIAGLYDVMNTVMTAGMHHRWRARAVELAAVSPGDHVLDVATGTGDLAAALLAAVTPGGTVVACDFSEEMLTRARKKVPDATVEWADALALPYATGEFAAATVGFGARNFSDLDQGIREMVRVVRPGGRVVILEITQPTRQPLAGFYRGWFDRVVPALGRLSGNADAYSYLPSSVRRFPAPPQLAELMARSGLQQIHYILTAGGIIALHVGEVPAGATPQDPSS
jgi:demethylmenaquinone methyltransferase/2-methoxy-6-polyprenyl-1,4-benzoquinol methylase